MTPIRPRSPCRWALCPERAEPGGRGYCTAHERRARQLRDREDREERKASHPRASASQRGYGVGWRRIRAWYLRRHPLCECQGYNGCEHRAGECYLPANEVDHKAGQAAGNGEDNLQAVCKACHSRKTTQEDGRWQRND